jgi:hypothetical protein
MAGLAGSEGRLDSGSAALAGANAVIANAEHAMTDRKSRNRKRLGAMGLSLSH